MVGYFAVHQQRQVQRAHRGQGALEPPIIAHARLRVRGRASRVELGAEDLAARVGQSDFSCAGLIGQKQRHQRLKFR